METHSLPAPQQLPPLPEGYRWVCSDWLFNPAPSEYLSPVCEEATKRKRGRPSFASTNPEFVGKVQEIIDQHSAAAHTRRREDTSYSYGVSLPQIQSIVERELNLKVSRSTIHRLLLPPNKNHKAARYYKGLVNARVPAKSNSRTTKDHPDFRYTCVQVNYVNEMAALYSEEVVALSCDDKNKLNIGTPAVHRHTKVSAFFSTANQPDLPDHDFPYRNSKLTPSGYLVLTPRSSEPRSRSSSPPPVCRRSRRSSWSPPRKSSTNITTDANRRKRVVWPRGGPLRIYLHSDKYFPSTSQMHLNQLLDYLPAHLSGSGKSVVTIVCDGGPDWRTDSPCNVVNYGRLWRDLELDALILTSYAPYHSRYNPIERGFSPLSKWMAGTILPICLPGETVPPQSQNIPQQERDQKEMRVHDEAMKICSKVWGGREWGGFPVSVSLTPCNGHSLRYADHSTLTRLTGASLQALKNELRANVEEYRFLAKHLTRTTYQMEFCKCADVSCTHCSVRPIRARQVLGYLKRHGGHMPLPSWSHVNPGHYKTFIQTLTSEGHGPKQFTENLPSRPNPMQSCSTGMNCKYIPATKTDAARHVRLVHKSL